MDGGVVKTDLGAKFLEDFEKNMIRQISDGREKEEMIFNGGYGGGNES